MLNDDIVYVPANEESAARLLKYMMKNQYWFDYRYHRIEHAHTFRFANGVKLPSTIQGKVLPQKEGK